MCSVTAAIVGVVGVAGTAVQQSQQRSNIRAQRRFQDQLFQDNAELAQESGSLESQAVLSRVIQERERTVSQIMEVSREAAAAQATARVAAGAAGVEGPSVEALLGDFARQESNFRLALQRSQKFSEQQAELELLAVRNRTQSNILQFLPQPIAKPDFLGAALRIVGNVTREVAADRRARAGRAFRTSTATRRTV